MNFFQPTTLNELSQVLKQCQGTDCHLVAGCTDFLAQRNGKAWQADALISLTGIPQLQAITLADNVLTIGAACTHTHIEEHPLVVKYFPALVSACGDVGSKQIRNRGTIGGNVCNASPAGDTFPVLRCLGAQVVILTPQGQTRRLPVEELVLGIEKTALEEGEVVLAFELPLPEAGSLNAFIKLGDRPKVTIAKISLAVSLRLEDGVIRAPMVTLGAVGRCAFPAQLAMAALEGQPLSRDLFEPFSQALSQEIRRSIPNRASMPYKHRAVRGLADTILTDLIRQAQA